MNVRSRPRRVRGNEARSGFTLAELAVTLAIVAVVVLFVLQGIYASRDDAYHTHNLKLARELALLTLGRIESGQYQEEIRGSYFGPFVYEDNETFEWEVAFGGEPLRERADDGSFDSWNEERLYEEDQDDYDEDAAEPYEQVEIKVTFPPIGGRSGELFMVRYMPWTQVYGEDEEDEDSSGSSGSRP